MAKKTDTISVNVETPLVVQFNALAKSYFGTLTKELEQFELERYYYVLNLIATSEKISQQALADAIDVDKANMVRIIDYLSLKGYVKRKVNTNDRREHIITPTAKAKKLLPHVQHAFEKVNKEALLGFTKAEIKQFYNMLERVQHNLGELPADSYFVKYIKTSKK